MRNAEEMERLLKKVKEAEEELARELSNHKAKEEILAMQRRIEQLEKWLAAYESAMREVHRKILLAAEEEVMLYPSTVFGKSHFENLQEYRDLLLIKGKRVTQQ